MKAIVITVDQMGQVAMQTHGYAGQSCKDATEAFERALGLVLSDKPSFEQGATQSVVETQQ